MIFVAWTVSRSVFPIMASSPETWRVRRGAERGMVVLASVFMIDLRILGWAGRADSWQIYEGQDRKATDHADWLALRERLPDWRLSSD